jgi:quercetin dioxygenase-like cupin family protein
MQTTSPIEASAHWTAALRDELARNTENGCVGHVLVSETERVRVWSLRLAPGERIPFHRHVLDYFWTAVTAGRARSRFEDGRVTESAYAAGDTRHFSFAAGQSMQHDLENIGETELVFTTVEFLQGANAPLAVPDQVRRGFSQAA